MQSVLAMVSRILIVLFYYLVEIEGSVISFLSVASRLEHQVSKKCASDVKILSENLRNLTPWAMEMWESSARLPTGLLQGSKYQMGNFDQCLGLSNLEIEPTLQRQYCLTTLTLEYMYPSYGMRDGNVPQESVLKTGNGSIWGLYSPASCSNEDLFLILQEYPYFVRFFGEFNLTHRIVHNQCQTNESKLKFSFGSITFICCVCMLIIIVLWATKLHYEAKIKGSSEYLKVIRSLSILHNWRLLMRKDDDCLMMFNGLRVLTSLVVISVHFMLVQFAGPVANENYARSMIKHTPIEIAILAVGCGVDVFLVIGGFFAFFSISKNFVSKSKLQIITSRYFRLIPMYGFIMVLLATVSNMVGTGSLWHHADTEQINCEKNWWTNALFVNNYVNFDKACMPHTWYLACDFHYYLITILLCYFLAVPSREKLGLGITGALLVITMLVNSFVAYRHRYGPATVVVQDFFEKFKTDEEAKHYYLPSHTRMPPYIIGIFTAFIYQKYKNIGFKIPKVPSMLLLMSALVCLYGNASYMISFKDSPYDMISSVIYAAFHRAITGLCFGIIILICIFGDLPLAVSFLSCTPMVVLGRLTFAAYLISVEWQGYDIATARHPKLITIVWTPLELLWCLTVVFSFSLVGHLFVEAPFNNLYQIWTKREKQKFDIKNN